MPFKHQTLHPWVAWRLVVEAGGGQWGLGCVPFKHQTLDPWVAWRVVVAAGGGQWGVAVRAFQTSDTAALVFRGTMVHGAVARSRPH